MAATLHHNGSWKPFTSPVPQTPTPTHLHVVPEGGSAVQGNESMDEEERDHRELHSSAFQCPPTSFCSCCGWSNYCFIFFHRLWSMAIPSRGRLPKLSCTVNMETADSHWTNRKGMKGNSSHRVGWGSRWSFLLPIEHEGRDEREDNVWDAVQGPIPSWTAKAAVTWPLISCELSVLSCLCHIVQVPANILYSTNASLVQDVWE